ncbi:MAG: NUDIX hydrolase [Nitrospirae bacterium]|nr:NUDIX hydrolase [Candidatus Manganitrophaceae bacterium]
MDLTETLLRTQVVYQGRYLRAEEQIVRQPDGREAKREIIVPPDAVGILPIDTAGNVYLVRQYRPAIKQITLEIPAGVIDPGEKPLETAGRECAEEIGYHPKQLDFMFMYYHSVGFSSGKIEVFLGRNLDALPAQSLDAGEFIEIVTLSFEEAHQQALSGKIVDSKTFLAFLWYKAHFLSK